MGVSNQPLDPVALIQHSFEERKKKNPKYSLRAHAKYLNLSSGRLSQLLSGKRKLTLKTGEGIADKMFRNLKERELFLKQITKSMKTRYGSRKGLYNKNTRRLKLNNNSLLNIADPIHFNILSLIETDNFTSDPKWISERLGLDLPTVNKAIKNLLNANLIEISNNSEISIVSSRGVETSSKTPNTVIQAIHKKTLVSAISKLDSVPVEVRDFSTLTLAVNPEKFSEATKLIRKFENDLEALLTTGNKSEVYRLNIQLYPETLIKRKKALNEN